MLGMEGEGAVYSCVASIGSSESLAASACVPLTGSREPGVHMCPSSTSLLPWALHCCFQHDVRYMYLSAFTVGGVPGVSLAVFACRTAPIERCVTLACTFLDPYILLASSSAACIGAWRKCLLYGHQYWPLRAVPSCVLPSFPSCCSMPSLLPKCLWK